MKIEQVTVAYRNPDPEYHADFAAVAVTAEGEVVMLARKCGAWARDATFKFGRPLTFFERHAEMIVLRSTDGGGSFNVESRLHAGLAIDPMVFTLADGRVMAGMVVGEAGSPRERAELRGVLHRHLPQLETVITVCGISLWFSRDHGRTWSDPPQLVSLPGWENIYHLRKPVQLADGTILMPITTGYPWRSRFVAVLRSWDDGETWCDPSVVAEDPSGRAYASAGFGYWQPAMALTPAGDLVCVCSLDESAVQRSDRLRSDRLGESQDLLRPSAALPSLYRTGSQDSGFTWSQARDTGLEGDFPSLTGLSDGRLVLTCTQRRRDRSAVLACVTDDGLTWGPPLIIREAVHHLFHQVTTVVLADGTALTVYTATPPNQVRVVEAVRWRME